MEWVRGTMCAWAALRIAGGWLGLHPFVYTIAGGACALLCSVTRS
jgi:hypothetical protein